MNTPLTEKEENLIKDIILTISNDNELNARIRLAVMTKSDSKITKLQYERMMDSVFTKLQNGRVTVEYSN